MITVDSYDLVTVEGDFITVDLVIWRRYRNVTRGATERMLDDNPHLAEMSRSTPFLLPQTQLRIPLNNDMLKGRPAQKEIVKFVDNVDPTASDVIKILS